ncbi:LUD domain-containing protein [Natronolimnobius sp. AArcel1]|uniref:LUD domain-containing protein n=1 Tax=Natronolimnobius sp. AArcel1 TaxID=1679093 RepID=UPI0013EC4BFC|nr:LUD domain-containing protein [Natronolimnobius sp. AArcel1]NGM70361.1 LUD domain-containing protein [Natronolimnobius sp. AArcel1]
MSRNDHVETPDHCRVFRDRLTEVGVDSTIIQATAVAHELEQRLEYPAVGAPLRITDASLPAEIEDEPTLKDLKRAAAGATSACLGVASQGSIVVTPNVQLDGPVSLYPPKHIAVLQVSDIVPDTASALEELSSQFATGANDAVFITGPSSTGDMGKSVVGVHGPAELEVLLVE